MIKKPRAVLRPLFAISIILALTILPSALKANPRSYNPSSQTARTVITRNDETGLVFDLITPQVIVDDSETVTVSGLDVSVTKPGAPALPHFTTYIAIPPHATFSIEVEGVDPVQHTGVSIQPVATHSLKSTEDFSQPDTAQMAASLYEPAAAFSPDPLLYESDSYYPQQNFKISDELFAADLRLVKLDLYPLRYNAVRSTLHQATRLAVRVQFEDAELQPADSQRDNPQNDLLWRDMVLNYPPASWHVQAPVQESAVALTLPIGVDTFKIEVDHDGLYAISGSELAALGLDLAAIDPGQLQMMQRGKAVSYQFVNNDGNAGFGASDEIRFYGWAFDGSRYEDMYVSDNVFWLWANGGGAQIQPVENEAGNGYTEVTKFNETITMRPHLNYFPGLSVNWDVSPNDATAWHGKRLVAPAGTTRNFGLPLTLPDPATGTDAAILVEFTSRYSTLYNTAASSAIDIALNGNSNLSSVTFKNGVNLNVEHVTPVAQFLKPGQAGYPENILNISLSTTTANNNTAVYVTQVTVDYPRNLSAVSDELIFGRDSAGQNEFHISGFSSAASGNVVVWDISNQYVPNRVDMQSTRQFPNGASATVVVGRTHGANARFIATTTDNIQQVKHIEKYVPASLNPPGEEGTWVAVSHNSLLPAANDLAKFRASQSGISTWVVDVQDVANQTGYGFNTPDAIRDYLRAALSNWKDAPQYLTLFGDATVNPRLLDCEVGCSLDWDANKKTLVPTDLLFVDRFNGLIPVDYTFSLLVGDDLYPELAVGRITAEDLSEAQDIVQKIKTYETSFMSEQPWHKNVVFVADNTDSGGSFCLESQETALRIPDSFNKNFLCLPDVTPGTPEHDAATVALREELFNQINNVGMPILNYRGHGGVTGWAGYPHIMHIDYASGWENVGRPIVVLSADCLDGDFASTSTEGLGETIIELGNNRGSAAHWSSTGLGFTFEHSILHKAFYHAIFEEGTLRTGDIINYAKIVYLTKGYDESEAYAFTYLGDPAMAIMRSSVSLPVVVRP